MALSHRLGICLSLAIILGVVAAKDVKSLFLDPEFLGDDPSDLKCTQSYPANNCEFWVDGIAETDLAYQGYHQRTLMVQYRVQKPSPHPNNDTVIAQILRVQNNSDGTTFQTLSYAKYNPDQTLFQNAFIFQSGLAPNFSPNLTVIDMTFVMKRLWVDPNVCLTLTNAGKPFSMEETFQPPLYTQWIGRVKLNWANQNVAIFNQKHACGH